ncbi:hypothetical protein [Ferrimonas futtsuensis]|uniref:hypothetical protein n=1 Tax=Ferrimonas futtsuensis TaxID=364764 RepID=UPI00040C83C7|nr:hypothetical protein [Ferrimonas futtsuensis]
MTKWIAWLGAAVLFPVSAQEPHHTFELVSNHCQEQECLLLWTYQGRYAPTGPQLLDLYRQGERFGRGAITLEEDIVSRTLLMRVERVLPSEPLGEAGDPCDQGQCAP